MPNISSGTEVGRAKPHGRIGRRELAIAPLQRKSRQVSSPPHEGPKARRSHIEMWGGGLQEDYAMGGDPIEVAEIKVQSSEFRNQATLASCHREFI